jgi:hypothetical protein
MRYSVLDTMIGTCSQSSQNRVVQALTALSFTKEGAGKITDIPCLATPPGDAPARSGFEISSPFQMSIAIEHFQKNR